MARRVGSVDWARGAFQSASQADSELSLKVEEHRKSHNTCEQVLTVIVLKHWCLDANGQPTFFAEGIDSSDAENRGLKPIIGARLGVVGLPIHVTSFAVAAEGLDLGALLMRAWKRVSNGEYSYFDTFHGRPDRLHIDSELEYSLPILRSSLEQAGIEIISEVRSAKVLAGKRLVQRHDLLEKFGRWQPPGFVAEYFAEPLMSMHSLAANSHKTERVREWTGGSMEGLVLRGANAAPRPHANWQKQASAVKAARILDGALKQARKLWASVSDFEDPDCIYEPETARLSVELANDLQEGVGLWLDAWEARFSDLPTKRKMLMVDGGLIRVMVGQLENVTSYLRQCNGLDPIEPVAWPGAQNTYGWEPASFALEFVVVNVKGSWVSEDVEVAVVLRGQGMLALKQVLSGKHRGSVLKAIRAAQLMVRAEGVSALHSSKFNVMEQMKAVLTGSDEDVLQRKMRLVRCFDDTNTLNSVCKAMGDVEAVLMNVAIGMRGNASGVQAPLLDFESGMGGR